MLQLGRILAAACLAAIVVAPASAQAADFPDRPVRMIVPFPPGGTNDILGRFLAQRLTERFGKPFVVENRSGAGGLVGTDHAAKSAPDGYTLLLSASGPLAVALAMYDKVPYDVSRDFSPIAVVGEATMVLVTNPDFKPRTLKELLAYSKANPLGVRAAINATGSMHHLLTELFALDNGTRFTMVPYRGSGPAIIDVLAGHIDLDIENLPAVSDHIKAGKLRAVATLSNERAPQLPDIPTFKESGYPKFVASPWFALVAPAGTPPAIIAQLNEAVVTALNEPEAREWLYRQGAAPVRLTHGETAEKLRSEAVRWAEIVRTIGVKAN